ncbi:MAG TPA: hypothetical protein VEW91_00905 [bacterium]|nr:hypothetical protein [bacterium]
MVWYRCSCGHITEIEPHVGEVVSVYHLHAQTGVDRSALVRMEPLLDSVPEPALATAGPRPK